ncbi:MAG: hypothetical protein ABEK17_04300 [Candidatus Aenigmatarchaeota archaeon]
MINLKLEKANKILAISILFLSFILTSHTTLAVVNQIAYIDGKAYLKTMYDNGEMELNQIFKLNGTAYINLTIETGEEELKRVKDYVRSLGGYVEDMEGKWASDSRGASITDVANTMQDAANYRDGYDDTLSETGEKILDAIDRIANSRVNREIEENINPTLNTYYKQIQDNIYSIEAISNTLEVISPEKYCEMKREVIRKYNLPKVKCGLHSKICYNGEKYPYEGGRDYCIHTDMEDVCYTKGGCGHVEELGLFNSEVDSYLPVYVKFYNSNGELELEPYIEVQLYMENGENVVRKAEGIFGKIKPGNTKDLDLLVNTTGLEAGIYRAKITVSSGEKEIIDVLGFKLYSGGEIPREGLSNYVEMEENPEIGKNLSILGNFQSTQELPVTYQMVGKVYLNDTLIKTLNSERQLIKYKNSKDFTLNFVPGEYGNYTIIIGMKNMEPLEKLEFSIEKSIEETPTGEFLNSAMPSLLVIITVIVFLTLILVYSDKLKKLKNVIIS